jgi:site-specific DNA-methyltransferase (adenine-specific)
MKYSGFKNEKHFDRISFYNGDCMDLLKQTPDKYYDLAIVDPPYGIGADKNQEKLSNKKGFTKGAVTYKEYHKTNWDNNVPKSEYFEEIKRVSKYQIVWGGNYFHDLHLEGVIVWNKLGSGNFKEGELAKTNINTFKVFDYSRSDAYINDCDIKIHPTQKPIKLYDWILHKYAKKNQKIIDTHLGSGSIALAIDKANKFDNMNLEFVGIELDTEYYNAALNRFEISHSQTTIFD